MTAGQGDQQGQPDGRPQGQDEQPQAQGGQPSGWPPAPQQGQPPYGQQPPHGQQPPYGQAPPYGQPPYGQHPYGQLPYGQQPYGYAPAPSAPGWGPDAPTPMERPLTVRAGIGAFMASLVLSAIASVAMLLNWDEVLDWTLAQSGAGIDDPELEGFDVEAMSELILQVSLAFSVLFLLLQLLVLWFAWQGRNWARIILWVLGGLTLLTAPFNTMSTGPFPFVTALTWFQVVLVAVGVVLLALKPSNDWYRFRKWQRATGQR
ncbi:hypothetical protein [Blastococcus montanus]|uniref:hypothetical protein n=1 Tax=Blastococcus montanus TaxID=3144973 RepID=UPI00320ABAD5